MNPRNSKALAHPSPLPPLIWSRWSVSRAICPGIRSAISEADLPAGTYARWRARHLRVIESDEPICALMDSVTSTSSIGIARVDSPEGERGGG